MPSGLISMAALSPLLRSFNSRELAVLDELSEIRHLAAEEVLMAQGEPADFFAVVLSGSLRAAIPESERSRQVSRPHEVTKLQEWRFLPVGAIVGEMSLFSGLVRTTAVEALTDCTLAIICFADLHSHCDAELSARVRTGLANIGMSRLSSNLGDQQHAPPPPQPSPQPVPQPTPPHSAAAAPTPPSPAATKLPTENSLADGGDEKTHDEVQDQAASGSAATEAAAAPLGPGDTRLWDSLRALSLDDGVQPEQPAGESPRCSPTPCRTTRPCVLSGASPSTVRGLASLLQLRAFHRGERLLRAGDAASYLAILCEGTAEVRGGDSSPGQTVGRGAVVGGEPFFGGGRRAHTTIATSDGVAACVLYRALASAFFNGETSVGESSAARWLVAQLALLQDANARSALESSSAVPTFLSRWRLSGTPIDHPDQQQQAVLRLTAQLRQRQWEVSCPSPQEGFLAVRQAAGTETASPEPSTDTATPEETAAAASGFRFSRPVARQARSVAGDRTDDEAAAAQARQERRAMSVSRLPRGEDRACAGRDDVDAKAERAHCSSLPSAAAPVGALSIQICSWNLNGKVPNDQDLASWLALDDRPPPDVVCVGCQEFTALNAQQLLPQLAKKQEFEHKLVNMLNHIWPTTYVPVTREVSGRDVPPHMLGLLMLVFVRADEVLRVQGAVVLVPTGMGGLSGNKGGICFRLTVAGFPLLLINVHLPSGQSELKERNSAFKEVLKGATQAFVVEDLPAPLSHHTTIVFGDFNYRLTLQNREVRWRLSCRDWLTCLAADQLALQLGAAGSEFEHWDEADITFRPTYKYDAGTNSFDSSDRARAPAWCDRVLWRVGKQTGRATIEPLLYDSCQKVLTSDHKPLKFLSRVHMRGGNANGTTREVVPA